MMSLVPSSVTGPANFPPAMPNSSGFSVSTRSFIWMRVDRSCSGSCAGRRIVPALTRTSASTLSQRDGSNGASGRTPPSFGWSVPTTTPRSARSMTLDCRSPCMKGRSAGVDLHRAGDVARPHLAGEFLVAHERAFADQPAFGHVGRRLRQSDVDDVVKLRERVAAEADPGFDLLELDQPGDAAVYGDPGIADSRFGLERERGRFVAQREDRARVPRPGQRQPLIEIGR